VRSCAVVWSAFSETHLTKLNFTNRVIPSWNNLPDYLGLTKSRPHSRTVRSCGRTTLITRANNLSITVSRGVDTVKTAQTDRTLSVYALPQEHRFNIPCNFRIAKTKNAPEKEYGVDDVACLSIVCGRARPAQLGLLTACSRGRRTVRSCGWLLVRPDYLVCAETINPFQTD